MSFYRDLERLKETLHSFCVPAHKGRAEPRGLHSLDLTEQPESDNAADPKGALRESERLCSELFESGDTLYCTSGCSTALKAAIGYTCGYGTTLLAAVPTHRCLADAAAIFGLRLSFVETQGNKIEPRELRTALEKNKVTAVFFCYCDYDGNILNLAELMTVCREFGVKVIVDNAHGGYLRFLSREHRLFHPLLLGGDIVVDSGSKTLGMLTPAALIHLKDKDAVDGVRRILNILSTTSPPYPVMYSMDRTIRALSSGKIDFSEAVRRSLRLKERYGSFLLQNDEPLKIAFSPRKNNLDIKHVEEVLRYFGIMSELCNVSRVLFMPSPFNNERDFAALEKALDMLVAASSPNDDYYPVKLPLPRLVLPTITVFRRIEMSVDIDQAVGRISADTVAPCPPGTVVLFAGQVIEQPHVELLRLAGIKRVAVGDVAR